MNINNLINYKEVSRILAGNEGSIRKNKVPEIYKPRVDLLKKHVRTWRDGIDKNNVGQHYIMNRNNLIREFEKETGKKFTIEFVVYNDYAEWLEQKLVTS